MDSSSSHSLDETFGVLLIGFVLAITLYGWTFFQSYIFFTRYPKEFFSSKVTVALLWSIDTVSTALLSHAVYYYLITNFLFPLEQLRVTRTLLLEKTFSSILICIVQLFYSFRTWHLNSRRAIVAESIALSALISFVLSIVGITHISTDELLINFVSPNIKLLFGLSEGILVLSDLLIVVSHYHLLQPKRRPGMKIAHGWFENVVLHVLSRGTLFSVMQLLVMIMFVATPQKFVWTLFHFITSKIYVNSLLAMLTSRHTFRGRGLNEEDSLNLKRQRTTTHTTGGGLGGTRRGNGSLTSGDPTNQGLSTQLEFQMTAMTDGKSAPTMTIELSHAMESVEDTAASPEKLFQHMDEEITEEVPRRRKSRDGFEEDEDEGAQTQASA
ncbi:hypothetical protein ABKN59_010240 [Abortiporus biennis]